MYDSEVAKIYKFIFEDKSLNDPDNVFGNLLHQIETLKQFEALYYVNEFRLNKEQEQVIINSFLSLETKNFNSYTPKIILHNLKCVEEALKEDCRNVSYLSNVPKEIEEYVINYFLNTKIENFPFYLEYWLDNLDEECAKYANVEVLFEVTKDPQIFKRLIETNFFEKNKFFQLISWKSYPLNCFNDNEVLRYAVNFFEPFLYQRRENEKMQSWIIPVIKSTINSNPTINKLEDIYNAFINLEWQNYKKENSDVLENIYGQIWTILRKNKYFNEAIEKMCFLSSIKKILTEDEYNTLYIAMKEYHYIYSKTLELEKLEPYNNIISNMVAMYVAKTKESFKKKWQNIFYDAIKPYFKLNINNKQIYENVKFYEQRNHFKKLYEDENSEILDFIKNLIKEYENILDKNIVQQMIDKFILDGKNKLSQIIDIPEKYSEYEQFQNAKQLIKRLNLSNISYNSMEVLNYKNIIAYKDNNYFYNGPILTNNELKECENYQNLDIIFKKIKKDIIFKVKKLTIYINENNDYLDKIKQQFPFNDEYFVFDNDLALTSFSYIELKATFIGEFFRFSENVNIFYDNKSSEKIRNLLVSQQLLWFFLLMKNYNEKLNNFIDYIIDIMNNMKSIAGYLNDKKELAFNDFVLANYLSNDESDVLGEDIVTKLCKYNNTTYSNDYIINTAKDLIHKMSKRTNSTVPYINGNYLGYKYSLYDPLDETILVSGIDTDSCFRIGGADNDFLLYSTLDKNGFVIKITDNLDNFIARASGFRNGNCVFINQLRTIYDQANSDVSYLEQKNIINVFEQACKEIISISQNNTDETNKIEHVFVTKSYSLKNYPSNVSNEVTCHIGCYPMENKSDDWQKFVKRAKNRKEYDFFSTDFGNYPLICIASVKQDELIPEDIKFGDVEALYDRKRSKIVVSKIDEETMKKINRIKWLSNRYAFIKLNILNIPENFVCVIGDNWYIIFDNNVIVEELCLEFDKRGVEEFNIAKELINEHSDISKINYEVKARMLAKK